MRRPTTRKKVCWCDNPSAPVGEICQNDRCGFEVVPNGEVAVMRRPVLAEGALRVELYTDRRAEAPMLRREVEPVLREYADEDPVRKKIEEILAEHGGRKKTKLHLAIEEALGEECPRHPVVEALMDKIEESTASAAGAAMLLIHPAEGDANRRIQLFRDTGKVVPIEMELAPDGMLVGLSGMTWLRETLNLRSVQAGDGGTVGPEKQIANAVRTALRRGRHLAERPDVDDAGLVEVSLTEKCHTYAVFVPGDTSDPVLSGQWDW